MMMLRSCLVGNLVSKQGSSSPLRFLSTTNRPFDKILIANRGEIACRIAKTCTNLGVETVSIYSEADKGALHTKVTTESYQIGTGPAARQSYLLKDQVLEIALRSGAQAIHPGYGFLSENASFAQAVAEAGLTFVGPPPEAIHLMGSKSESKALMQAAGVSVTPGFHGDEQQDADFLQEQAVLIGFPVLIKAIMGGGGKGMRLVERETDFKEALASCQQEALQSFGDARVLLEKYLRRPRHVEIQILADQHGNVVHLYERDCSLQRRHQKIIEEAPAADLPDHVRHALQQQGIQAAKAVNYVNAGTIEFLVDSQTLDFYFCEMNTRLQVEHPVTECLVGQDLVAWQLQVAAGQPLPPQDYFVARGHAMEARIYAEQPLHQFLPATGTVWHHDTPQEARVDTGIVASQDVSVYYDPMISKLIVYGRDREEARRLLLQALQGYHVAGVPTNIEFLKACARHATFGQVGATTTGFLEDHLDEILTQLRQPLPSLSYAAAAVLQYLLSSQCTPTKQPWSLGPWRVGTQGAKRSLVVLEPELLPIDITSYSNGSHRVAVTRQDSDTEEFHLRGTLKGQQLELVVNDTRRVSYATYSRMHPNDDTTHYLWSKDGAAAHIVIQDVFHSGHYHVTALASGIVAAPMPGKIVRLVAAQPGQSVQVGDVLVVMEAMKMEHAIRAPRDGVVTEVNCRLEDVVNDGHVLCVVENDMEQAV
jgi:3-methylcrotonyl-CoA carboxylase alpha subunit